MRIFYETYSMRGINNALEVFSYATLRIMILYTGQRKVLEITQFVVLIECCRHKLFGSMRIIIAFGIKSGGSKHLRKC